MIEAGRDYMLTTQNGLSAISEDHATEARRILVGIDTLRFVTAMWVAFSHGARFPIDRLMLSDTSMHKAIRFFLTAGFNGTGAVTIFFLVSGLCIHISNVDKRAVDPATFYIRRLVRIGVPLLVIIVAARIFGEQYVRSLDNVLWSVYCEIIYYLFYPIILPIIYRFGSIKVFLTSLIVSLLMAIFSYNEIYLWSFGLRLNWLFNAPLWLAGVVLASNLHSITSTVDRINIWFFRAVCLIFLYLTSAMAFNLGKYSIGFIWTMPIFSIFCIFWVASELRFSDKHPPLLLLERFGLAGYSIYLVHKLVITLFYSVSKIFYLPLWWALQLVAIAAAAFVFYKFVEWPSHKLARELSKRVSRFETRPRS